MGSPFHHRKTYKKYAGYPKEIDCPFCARPLDREIVAENENALVIPNRVFYDLWELKNVVDHLLVLPKRHVQSLSELSDVELLDVARLSAEFEDKHYNVYARAKASKQKSIVHQHTHLIKTNDKQARGIVNILKPQLLIKF